MMRPLVFVWPYAVGFWLLWLLVVWPEIVLELRAAKVAKAHRAQDRGSVKILHATGDSAFWLALAAAVFVPGATMNVGREIVFVVGLLLFAAGGLVRRHCFRMLGPYFTGTVVVKPDQPIVQRGAYRWVRHPSYAGAMVFMIGIGLAFTNWLSVGIQTILPAAGNVFRVRAEERALLATLGAPYREYMERTKRFFPYLF